MTSRFPRRRTFARFRLTSAANRRITAFIATFFLLCITLLAPGARFAPAPPLAILTPTLPGNQRTDHVNASDVESHSPGSSSSVTSEAGTSRGQEPAASQAQIHAEAPDISAVVLFHNEYATLNHTLQTWEANDLFSHISEVLIFLNGVSSAEEFYEQLPWLKTTAWHPLIRTIPSAENLRLGLAITEMVSQALSENVLLLEKDWALIEPKLKVEQTLVSARRLLDEKIAHVVRFRHRHHPGAPLHARIMHEGREPQMLTQQSNLFCYMHHWVEDPTATYSQFFKRCSEREEDAATWCSKARFCQWTNNPVMFKKGWFLRELGEPYTKMYKEMFPKDPQNNMLDFEFFMNWRSDVWNDRGFVVALPVGLFEHQEVGEQNLMNTVWYGWNRLKTDVIERSRAMLDSETADCLSSTKKREWGQPFKEKFPVSFAQLYHYNQSMERSVSDAVAELEAESSRLTERLERGEGNWRHGVTDFTNFWYRIALFSYPTEPAEMNMTFVTALFNQHEHSESDTAFLADIDVLASNLHALRAYPANVYCTGDTMSRIKQLLTDKHRWSEQQLKRLRFEATSVEDLIRILLTSEVFDRIKKIAASEEWQTRVRSRSRGTLPDAKAVAFSLMKPYILHDAARGQGILSDLTHFVWFDATSSCLADSTTGSRLSKDTDTVFRASMLLNPFVSTVQVAKRDEVEAALAGSGFETDALLSEMEKRTQNEVSNGVVLADGKTIGGSQVAVTLMKGYYDFVLRDMLHRGQLGTEREPLSIAMNNVQYNFEAVEGRSACRGGPGGSGVCDSAPAEYFDKEGRGACGVYARAGSCTGAA